MTSRLEINETLVHELIASQFPQWKDLVIKPVARSGWDNKTFHLGNSMTVRMPTALEYASQVEKEQKWLPKLAPLLTVKIPEPLAMGAPGTNYPFNWSIYSWLEGETPSIKNNSEFCTLAYDLACFLRELESIDAAGGPVAGTHSFYRGGLLCHYDSQMREAIELLKHKIDTKIATEIWETALSTSWNGSPVWVHGDISRGNLLVTSGKLSGVIDFGQLSIGDPACDLAIAWTLFEGNSRKVFRAQLPFDSGTWARGRAWALWKAMISASGQANTNSYEAEQCLYIIEEVLLDQSKH